MQNVCKLSFKSFMCIGDKLSNIRWNTVVQPRVWMSASNVFPLRSHQQVFWGLVGLFLFGFCLVSFVIFPLGLHCWMAKVGSRNKRHHFVLWRHSSSDLTVLLVSCFENSEGMWEANLSPSPYLWWNSPLTPAMKGGRWEGWERVKWVGLVKEG